MYHSFDETSKLDQSLYQLALYDVTRGRVAIIKNMEKAFELKEKTAKRFNYFKSLIQNGDCTFDFIRDDVLSRNGPYHKEKEINWDDDEELERIFFPDKDEYNEAYQFGNFLGYLLGTLTQEEKRCIMKEMGLEDDPFNIPRRNDKKDVDNNDDIPF